MMDLGGFGKGAKDAVFNKLLSQLDAYAEQFNNAGRNIGSGVGEGYEEGAEESRKVIQKSSKELLADLERNKKRFENALNKFPEALQKSFKSFNFTEMSQFGGILRRSLQNIKDIVYELGDMGVEIDISQWTDSMAANWEKVSASLSGVGDSSREVATRINQITDAASGAISQIDNETDSIKNQTSALQEHEKATERATKSLERYMYHAGKFRDNGRKAESLGSLYPGRGTGFYGTGTYGVDLQHIKELAGPYGYGDRPISIIDTSAYNLYDAVDNNVASALHTFLTDFTSKVYGSKGSKKINSLYNDFKKLFPDNAIITTYDEFKRVAEEIATYVLQNKNRYPNFYEMDSAPTVLMKMLGYEGINTLGSKYANTEYGTVIYDLKEESIICKEITDELQKQLVIEGKVGEAISANLNQKKALGAEEKLQDNAAGLVQQLEDATKKEQELAAAAERAAQAKERQASITQRASSEISVEELIGRDIEAALAQLRSAKNNETTLFSLKGVFDGDDLISQARAMVDNIAEQANLSVGKFKVVDDKGLINVKLYNDELKIAVDQTYKLRAATEETNSATLELVNQSFSQNVKALNENNFDVEGIQQRALAAVEKVRSSLHGLAYDLTDLENAAKNITSQDDFTKFNNQLKATQDNIQAIKNSTVTGNSMNPLANMQRDMQNASTEIETMRMRLEKLGDIQGVEKANSILNEMTQAAQDFNKAQNAQDQQTAYNQYSNLKSQFKAQTEYIKAAKELNASRETNAKQIDPIREQYQSLLKLVNQINSVNKEIVQTQSKDGGSGILSGRINQLQAEKEQLISQIQGITKEIDAALGGGFVQGKEISTPFAKFLGEDNATISSFFNDTRTQASLTTKEIEKFVAALKQAENIDVQAATRVAEQFRSVQETWKSINSISLLDRGGEAYTGASAAFANVLQYYSSLPEDSTQWAPEQTTQLQALISKFNEYGNVLTTVGQRQSQYFSGKTEYIPGQAIESLETAKQSMNEVTQAEERLRSAANSYAKEIGGSGAIVTNFVQSADGISRLDFSVLDNATMSMRNFRIEMGSVTSGTFLTETTTNKFAANIQAAENQLSSIVTLKQRLEQSTGVDMGNNSIARMLGLAQQLNAELVKGASADQNLLTKLTKDARLSTSEVEKLYKQMMNMQSAVFSGDAIDLGQVSLNGNVYSQMIGQLKEFAATQPNATLAVGKFNEANRTLEFTLTDNIGQITEFKAKVDALSGTMIAQRTRVTQVASVWSQLGTELAGVGKLMKTAMAGYYSMAFVIVRAVKKGIESVKEIDAALTELKKVTDETNVSYKNFLQTASKTASTIGSTVSDFTKATAEFARLGYEMSESADMAKTAIVYKNVADGLDSVEESAKSIISTMKAFNIESDNTMSIADRFNDVGNNFAITSAGIGDALQRSAAALAEGGNTIDESIALITAANEVVQNPETVGTAFKTLSMRLRGAKVELEEAGEDVDGMAESTAQLQAELLALTGGKVDIMLDENTFKSTYQILKEMSAVWDDMTDVNRAAALELMAGKRQANVVATLLRDFETVEKVVQTSLDSEGSALAENEKYLDSIQGHIDVLNNSMETMWMNAIDSEVFKFFVDIANVVVRLTDKVGLLNVAISAFLAHRAFKSTQILGGLFMGGGEYGGLSFNRNSIYGKAANKLFKNSQYATGGTASKSAHAETDTLTGSQIRQGQAASSAASQNATYTTSVNNIGTAAANATGSVTGLGNAQSQQAAAGASGTTANTANATSEEQVGAAAAGATASVTGLGTAQTTQGVAATDAVVDNTAHAAAEIQVGTAAAGATMPVVDLAVAEGAQGNAAAGSAVKNEANASAITGLGVSAMSASFGVKMLNAALTMGISLIAGFAISALIKGLDALIKTNDELIEQADELKNAYKSESDTINDNLSTLKALESEFKKLSSGVDDYGNNISLATNDYERYKEIVEKILGISPSLVQGYDAEGNAIANKNGLLEKSIKLMQQEQRIKAQELVSDDNLKKIVKGNKAKEDEYKKENPLPYGNAKWDFMNAFKKAADEYEINKSPRSYDVKDIYDAIGVDYEWMDYTGDQANLFASDYYEEIVADLRSEDSVLKDYFTEEQIKNMLDIAAEYDKNVEVYKSAMRDINRELYDVLQVVPLSETDYYKLDGQMQGYISQYINNLEVTTDNLEDKKQDIIDLTKFLANNSAAQNIVSAGFTLKTGKNQDGQALNYKEYKKNIEDLIAKINNSTYTDEQKKSIFDMLGLDIKSKEFDNEIKNAVVHAKGLLQDEFDNTIDDLSVNDIILTTKITADPNSLSPEELQQKIQEIKDIQGIGVIEVKTYSELTEKMDHYHDLLKQTEAIAVDNTEVTQEYKDALKELGINTADLNECFYEGNPLLVKNAKALNNLVKSTKNNIARNAQLAKSQARLQYYELYKKMAKLVDANGKVLDGNEDLILSYYDEMKAIEQTIAKYSMLEAQLLGNVTAYEKFQKAQDSDSETDPISGIEEMVVAMGEAFNTAELGTETARAAISGLVPESVYKDLDTVDEKMAAIYDYFKSGKIAQYFTLSFDDDGNIESAEMKLGNLRKFIEDGLANKTFSGSDWQHFDFSEDFLAGLEDADDKLQYFADRFNVTKDVAFAMIESINDHDADWLNGDYSSMFNELLPASAKLELNIHKNTSALADLNAQVASNKITAEEYAQKYQELSASSVELGKNARDNISQYQDLTKQIDEQKTKVDEYTAAVQKMRDQGKSDEEIKESVEYTSLVEATTLYTELLKKRALLSEPTEIVIQFAIDSIDKEIDKIKSDLESKITFGEKGQYTVKVGVDLSQDDIDKLQRYKQLWAERHRIEVETDPKDAQTALEKIEDSAQSALDVINVIDGTTITINTSSAVSNVANLTKALQDLAGISTVKITTSQQPQLTPTKSYTTSRNDSWLKKHYAMADGTAHATGDWGLPRSEHDSLVGELGQELVVNPHTGRYYTVGDNGAEMVDLPKDAIIFNHRQTEELLKNGHINSRGKAYAEGNAHAVTIWPNGSSQSQWEGTGYSSWDDPTYDLANALDDAADSVGEFEETIDWIEMRMEELSEDLGLYSAKLENAIDYADKNSIIDTMIDINKSVRDNALAGAKYYEQYAEQYLTGMSDELIAAAKDGSIAITEFTKEQDEATVNAIQNYREYSQKAADLYQQAEEALTDIRDFAVQKIDNAEHSGAVKADVENSQTEKLQNAVKYDEERGLITDPAYYAAMIENSNKTIEYLTSARNEMQNAFNEAVQNGTLIKGSDEWYENLDKLYQIDAEIDEATIKVEEFKNSINDIYWDNFDQLINRLDYLKDETQSLIDLMDEADMVITPETDDGWSADQVEWTKEGIASLGLYAQQMEIAEYTAKQYADAIDDLTADYNAGLYSENEYVEKLNELKNAQYENIEAYYEAQDAIVDLNKTRVDSIKKGIEKEIEAYEELIDKKKEALSSDKDLYDFHKSTMQQQKEIVAIQRQIASISAAASQGDLAAIAKKKQLEAELAEAQSEMQDSYYDRSVSNQQNALDKELEDFKTEKDEELEKWEEYLTNVELVVTESLGVVKDNALGVYDTLNAKAQEYDLTLSQAIQTPWQDGMLAVSDYQTVFDTAMSSTTDQLEALKNKWQEVIDKMAEAADQKIDTINKENDSYAAATKKPESKPEQSTTNNQTNTNQPKTITVGGKINAGSAQIYSYTGGQGYRQYFANDPVYTVLATKGDWIQVRHHSLKSGITGWFKKGSVKALASGTTNLKKSGIVNIDELGEELVLRAQNGRLTYLEKGSGVIPADLTSNLMEWGQLDPTSMLEQNKPSLGVHPEIHNTEIQIDNSIAELIHIDNCSTETLPDVQKIVNEALEKHTQRLNQSLRKFTR